MAKRAVKRASVKTGRKPLKPVPTSKNKGKRGAVGAKNLVLIKKGEHPVGRKKGTPNKFTYKLKEAILEAAEKSGRDGKGKDGAVGYLVWLSRAEPSVFGRMLEKVMPMQIDVRDKSDRTMNASEAVERLRERGLPVPPALLSLAEAVGKAVAKVQESDTDEALDAEGIDVASIDDDADEDIDGADEPEEDDDEGSDRDAA